MTFKKIITFVLIAFMTTVFSTPAMAGRGACRGSNTAEFGQGTSMQSGNQIMGFKAGLNMGFGKGLFMGGLISELNLTEEQKNSIENILLSHQEQMADFSTQRITAEMALSSAVHANIFNETAIRQASQDLAAIKEEMNVLRAGVVAQINELLTEEQLTIVDEWEAKRLECLENRLNSMQSKIDEWLESEAD